MASLLVPRRAWYLSSVRCQRGGGGWSYAVSSEGSVLRFLPYRNVEVGTIPGLFGRRSWTIQK